MARKKTIHDELELQDYNMEENPQYPEGETPAEGAQDTALDGDFPPNGDVPVFPEDEPPFEERDTDAPAETSAADLSSGDALPEPEATAPEEDDYGAILQAMESTAPVEEAPLMLDPAQEVPADENSGTALEGDSLSAWVPCKFESMPLLVLHRFLYLIPYPSIRRLPHGIVQSSRLFPIEKYESKWECAWCYA